MPEMVRGRPFQKLESSYKDGFNPDALLNFLRIERLAPPRPTLLR
jgi:hypothetical protein